MQKQPERFEQVLSKKSSPGNQAIRDNLLMRTLEQTDLPNRDRAASELERILEEERQVGGLPSKNVLSVFNCQIQNVTTRLHRSLISAGGEAENNSVPLRRGVHVSIDNPLAANKAPRFEQKNNPEAGEVTPTEGDQNSSSLDALSAGPLMPQLFEEISPTDPSDSVKLSDGPVENEEVSDDSAVNDNTGVEALDQTSFITTQKEAAVKRHDEMKEPVKAQDIIKDGPLPRMPIISGWLTSTISIFDQYCL